MLVLLSLSWYSGRCCVCLGLNSLFSIKKEEEKNVVTTHHTPGWRRRKVGSPLRLRDPERPLQKVEAWIEFKVEGTQLFIWESALSLYVLDSITGLLLDPYLSICLSVCVFRGSFTHPCFIHSCRFSSYHLTTLTDYLTMKKRELRNDNFARCLRSDCL